MLVGSVPRTVPLAYTLLAEVEKGAFSRAQSRETRAAPMRRIYDTLQGKGEKVSLVHALLHSDKHKALFSPP